VYSFGGWGEDPQAGGVRGSGLLAGCVVNAGVRARESHRLQSLWRLKHEDRETVAVDASIAYFPPAGAAGGQPEAGNLEDGLFSGVREHAESMIGWAKSAEALALEHDQLEERAMVDGLELMWLLNHADLHRGDGRGPCTCGPPMPASGSRSAWLRRGPAPGRAGVSCQPVRSHRPRIWFAVIHDLTTTR
jgi:hypothetical protein